ncbi:MAG TPA: hypothetical protein VFX01_08960 [Methylophilaceae bacterium]|nr:hypothetical protein [Methylophilaceae bacterium]
MSFYSDIGATANRLIADKGQSVTITKITAGTYNPDTGTVENTETTYTGNGVLLDYNLQDKGVTNEGGALIQMGDKKLLLSPIDTSGTSLPAFEPNDTVLVDGNTWTVVNAKVLSPAGTIVLQELQIRK